MAIEGSRTAAVPGNDTSNSRGGQANTPPVCQALRRKTILFKRILICRMNSPSPRRHEGRSRDRHATWCGLRWAAAGVRCVEHQAKRWQRTVKSCGPGAATLALRWREFSAGNGGKKGRSPGRVRISRKTIARGKPGCLGCTCQIRVRSFLPIAHGATGAAGARLSLRPLIEEGATKMQNPDENESRERFRLFEN